MGGDGCFWTIYTYVYINICIWTIYTFVALLIGANNCKDNCVCVAVGFAIANPKPQFYSDIF